MNTRGYMQDVDWDGHTLTVTGTTKAARIALAGADHAAGPVTVDRADMDHLVWKSPGWFTNGRVDIHTTNGRVIRLHFRAKQAGAFTQLVRQLEVPMRAGTRPLIP